MHTRGLCGLVAHSTCERCGRLPLSGLWKDIGEKKDRILPFGCCRIQYRQMCNPIRMDSGICHYQKPAPRMTEKINLFITKMCPQSFKVFNLVFQRERLSFVIADRASSTPLIVEYDWAAFC